MSSKGQIVIPFEMREDLPEGKRTIIIKEGGRIIMKRASKIDTNLKEDILFAKRTEAALKRYEQGTFKTMKSEDFLKDLTSW